MQRNLKFLDFSFVQVNTILLIFRSKIKCLKCFNFEFYFSQVFIDVNGRYRNGKFSRNMFLRSLWFFKSDNFGTSALRTSWPKLPIFWNWTSKKIPDWQKCVGFKKKTRKRSKSLHPNVQYSTQLMPFAYLCS